MRTSAFFLAVKVTLYFRSCAFIFPSSFIHARGLQSVPACDQLMDTSWSRLQWATDEENAGQEPSPTSFSSLSKNMIPELPKADHPLLAETLPYMIDFFKEYGHSNVPLGNVHGKRCSTLRRLHHAGSLSPTDHAILTELKFQFEPFTFDPETVDFASLLGRLLEYNDCTGANFQIPKKYAPDPQLGAFVAYIRRLGPDGVDPSWAEALASVKFVWKSTRKCGSSFMVNWRRVAEKYEKRSVVENVEEITVDEKDLRWFRSQADLFLLGKLKEERVKYMDQLPIQWRKYASADQSS